jgi:hypothetical protein
MLRKYLIGIASACGASLVLASTANALIITGGLGPNGGVAVPGIGNQCLEIGGVASTAPGNVVDGFNCDGLLNQVWQITNGQIQKINNGSFTCLETLNGGTTSGTIVALGNCKTGAKYQLWNVNVYGAIVFEGATDMCLDWAGAYLQNGARLEIRPCDGSLQQQFWLR